MSDREQAASVALIEARAEAWAALWRFWDACRLIQDACDEGTFRRICRGAGIDRVNVSDWAARARAVPEGVREPTTAPLVQAQRVMGSVSPARSARG